MKKAKVIAGTLAVATMLMGAGYAAWTDTLNVTNTIDTGELKVEFVNSDGTGHDGYWTSPRIYTYSNGQWNGAAANDLVSSDVKFDKKTMTFTFGNMYPGTRANFKYAMQNTGTIPAVVQGVKVTATTLDPGAGDAEVLSKIKVMESVLTVVNSGVSNATDINDISLADLETKLNNFYKGKRLQPSDTLVLGGDSAFDTFKFELPFDSLSGDQGEKEKIQIEIKFDFVQANMYDPS